MTALVLNTEIFRQLNKVAQEKESTVEALGEEVIRQFLQAEAEQKMAVEIEAFQTLHPDLLTQYPDHFVAIYQGQLVDQDTDQLALLLRIEAQYPNEVVLIRLVLPEVDPIYTIHSTRYDHG